MTIQELTSTIKLEAEYLLSILLEALTRSVDIESEKDNIEIEIQDSDYEDILNEQYPCVEVCDLRYSPGYVLRRLDRVAFNQSRNDYTDSLDTEDTDEWKELEEENEEIADYIDEIHEAIAETPFGIAAGYNESPSDFFCTHIVSDDTVNPYDTIPVMLDLLVNTPEYEQLRIMGNYHYNLQQAIALRGEVADNEDVKEFQENIGEIAAEYMDCLNAYAPDNFRFGFGEHNGSDLGYWFDADFYVQRNHLKVDLHIDKIEYHNTFNDENALAQLCNELTNERFVSLPYTSKKTNALMFVIYDTEQKKVLSVCHRYGTMKWYLEALRSGEKLPVIDRYQYRFQGTTPGSTTHEVFDTYKQETVQVNVPTRQECLELSDQLNALSEYATFNRFEFPISRQIIESVPLSGAADFAIANAMTNPKMRAILEALDFGLVVDELLETGVWERDELTNDKEGTLERLLWIACCNINEEQD